MPFSWKKKRCNRFSQLVADHLQSPKRGGSLVVETGFPTSLIDLYVRNRGRFRRSKKQRGNDSPNTLSSCSSAPESGLLVDSDHLSSSSLSYSLVDLNNSSSGGSDHGRTDEIIEEDVGFGVCMVASDGEIKISSDIEVERSVEMVKLNPALVVLLKVLFMVILILGTKRFTIGITVSAFLLLFLELVGKRLLARSRSLRSSVDSKTCSDSSFQEIKNTKSSKENTNLFVCTGVLEIEEQLESEQDVRSEKELDSKTLFKSSFQETKNVKSSKENTNLVVCSGVLGIEEEVESKREVRSENGLDEVRSEVSMEIRRKTSRRAIMKSRMKRLVPKKLRKPTMGSKEEVCYEIIEEGAQDHKTLVVSSECSDSKGETLRILKQNQGKIVEIEGRSLSSALSSEVGCNDKELGRKLHQNSECLKLCLIVLVGLIGGRVLAVVLALSWCLMLKKLQWRNVKFPIS